MKGMRYEVRSTNNKFRVLSYEFRVLKYGVQRIVYSLGRILALLRFGRSGPFAPRTSYLVFLLRSFSHAPRLKQ